MEVQEVLSSLGGVASRDELVAAGCWSGRIDLSIYYGKIIPVRRGRYVLPGTDPRLLRALRVGGRLACVSALAFYQDIAYDGPVHVLVQHGASRLGGPAVIHWTRLSLDGTRFVVSAEVAAQQARNCTRAAMGARR
jgi:hypothetical protein